MIEIIPSESSLCPIGKVVTILMVFGTCGELQAEKSKSIGYLHILNSNSMAIVHSKRRYLLQKLHTLPYQFDGNRFFYVNNETLIGVRSSHLILKTFLMVLFLFTDSRSYYNLHGLLLSVHE